MIQRDYILRLIDRFAIVLQRLLSLRKAQQHEEAKVLITQTFRSLVGLEPKLVEALATQDLIGLLTTGGETDPAKCIVAAGLLEHRAEIAEIERDPEAAREYRTKALELCLYVANLPGQADSIDQNARIEALLGKLDPSALPESVQEKLRLSRRRSRD